MPSSIAPNSAVHRASSVANLQGTHTHMKLNIHTRCGAETTPTQDSHRKHAIHTHERAKITLTHDAETATGTQGSRDYAHTDREGSGTHVREAAASGRRDRASMVRSAERIRSVRPPSPRPASGCTHTHKHARAHHTKTDTLVVFTLETHGQTHTLWHMYSHSRTPHFLPHTP